MFALCCAFSKYSSQRFTSSSCAALSIASLSSLLHTICSPSNALLSSPKMVSCPSNCRESAGKKAGLLWILRIRWFTRSFCKCTQPPIARSSGMGKWGTSIGSSCTSVSVSDNASSDAAIVGDKGTTSASKYEGAGEPGGVKNCLSLAMISSSDKSIEGDARRGGIGSGNNDDEDVGEGVVTRTGVIVWLAFRKMCKCIGSSPDNTSGGMGPFNEIE